MEKGCKQQGSKRKEFTPKKEDNEKSKKKSTMCKDLSEQFGKWLLVRFKSLKGILCIMPVNGSLQLWSFSAKNLFQCSYFTIIFTK